MMSKWLYVVKRFLMCLLLLETGCSNPAKMLAEESIVQQQLQFAVPENSHIDSALVFFLRKQPQTDSLVLRKVIYNIDSDFRRFDFSLPAGYYTMIIFGNVGTEHVVAKPPYSSDSIYVEYTGEQPPVVWYGRNFLDFGVDTVKSSGLLLATSLVELTIQKIPSGVSQINVDLLNTSAAMYLSGTYSKSKFNLIPSTILHNVEEDSTYTATFSCLPTASKNTLSTLEVHCYNAGGDLLYSGKSAPFQAQHSRISKIACSFSGVVPRETRQIMTPVDFGIATDYFLKWSYDEISL